MEQKERKKFQVKDGTVYELYAEDFLEIQEELLHREELLRGMNPVRYTKVEMYPEAVLGTVRVPYPEMGSFLHLGFYLTAGSLFLIKENRGKEEAAIGRYLQESRAVGQTMCSVLRGILEMFLAEEAVRLQEMEETLEEMESALMEGRSENFYPMYMEYRKRLSVLHAYYEQLADLGDMMEEDACRMFTEEDRTAWRRFGDRSVRFHNHSESLREYMVQIRELYQTQLDRQQNRVMGLLTAVTTIFFPLTLIAGWYGMNFADMPELGWKYSYPVVAAVSILILLAEIIFFKKKKML